MVEENAVLMILSFSWFILKSPTQRWEALNSDFSKVDVDAFILFVTSSTSDSDENVLSSDKQSITGIIVSPTLFSFKNWS